MRGLLMLCAVTMSLYACKVEIVSQRSKWSEEANASDTSLDEDITGEPLGSELESKNATPSPTPPPVPVEKCLLKAPITSIEVAIIGEALKGPRWIGEARHKIEDFGDSNNFTFDFGADVSISNLETDNPLMQTAGLLKLENKPAGDKKLADFAKVSVTKGGAKFSNGQFKKCGVFACIDKVAWYEHREENRHRIDSISVKINNVLIYQKSDLKFEFKHHALTWSDEDLKNSDLYKQIAASADCQ